MNEHPFADALRRLRVSLPRRSLFALALSAVLALDGAWSAGDVASRKRRRKKRKNTHRKRTQPIVRNAFGCVDVGLPCGGDSANCCSGICEGGKPKKGKRDASRCAGHDVGGCTAAADICTGISPVCGPDASGGSCFRTTGNASFCGREGACTVCRRDADCEADFGPGAACVVCASVCVETGGTFCSPAAR